MLGRNPGSQRCEVVTSYHQEQCFYLRSICIICFSVVQASHHPQWTSYSSSQVGEAGTALPWQCNDIWCPNQAEVVEGEVSQDGGREGGGRSGIHQGVNCASFPHGPLRLRQQQHNGTQLHLCVCERWVYETWMCSGLSNNINQWKYGFISSDPQNAFQHTIVNVILERAGENCIIPCLVTDPKVTHLALETCDGRPLPSGMSYHSNPQRGIIINNVRKKYEGCYVCVGQLEGVKVVSNKYTVDVLLGKWAPKTRIHISVFLCLRVLPNEK